MQTAAQSVITKAIDVVVVFAADVLLPTMLCVFAAAVVLRVLVTFTITRELWFAKEFEKRVHAFLDQARPKDTSFYVIAKRMLEKTYYELFEVRGIMKRRKPDAVASLTDRMFLIQHGCARLVRDSLKQIRFLRDRDQPKLLELAKSVFEHNPCFRRVMGVIPVAVSNDLLGVLPGLFIVGGIFGTFLGIMKALPELGGMELNDAEASKVIMDAFLVKVAFSMSTSAVGICLSVTMTLLNTLLSAERAFLNAVDKYVSGLDILWNSSANNALPEGVKDFDEHRDPIEALAEDALKKELDRRVPFVKQAS